MACRSVGLSVCHTSQPCKTAEPIDMPFELRTGWDQQPCIRWGSRSPTEGAIVGKGKVWVLSAVSCAKTAEPIGLPFGLCIRVGRRNHVNRIHQVASMCPHGRERWRHLMNTTESSVCRDDAALCQMTLTCDDIYARKEHENVLLVKQKGLVYTHV